MIGYIVVEGPHDVAFLQAVLRVQWGAALVQKVGDLPPLLGRLVPTSFPANAAGDFSQRVDVPTFLRLGGDWVVIHSAVGDGQLVARLRRTSAELNLAHLDAVGIVLDADTQKTPQQRFDALGKALQKQALPAPSVVGAIDPGPPRIGALVLPDNAGQGTLEALLLACGQASYPALMTGSLGHVVAMAQHVTALTADEKKDFVKPAGPNKATIATVASLLKPGKSMAVSVQDNAWITPTTLALPVLQPTITFLRDLLGLP
jgi:hypothetical protein